MVAISITNVANHKKNTTDLIETSLPVGGEFLYKVNDDTMICSFGDEKTAGLNIDRTYH